MQVNKYGPIYYLAKESIELTKRILTKETPIKSNKEHLAIINSKEYKEGIKFSPFEINILV